MNPTEAYRAASAQLDGNGSGADDPRVLRAVEEYLAALEAGRAPGRDVFLARHAAVADRLGEYLDGLELIHRAGSAAGPAAESLAAAADLAGAEPLGDFLLVRELGRGGMGVVYEAVQRSLNRRVALKVLPFAAALDTRQLQRFRNEAQAAAGLHHAHIVPVFGVGCERGVHYYAMQLIAGQTLAAVIDALRDPQGAAAASSASTVLAALSTKPDGPRSRPYFRAAAELGIQAAEALDHAHQLGVVHRDIKPGNLMLDAAGKLWVTDFGLAHVGTAAGLTMTGDLVGTLRYMSPEQALAKRVPVDHRTDVYSLGATLYELLTLRPAVAGNDRQELLRQIAFEEPVPPRRLDRTVPAELETIVLKAMEKNPADRYLTAKEVADDLRRFLADEPIRAKRPTPVQRARKWGRRHPAMVAALAAALTAAVLVLGGSAGWIANDQHTRAKLTQHEVGTALDESVVWQQRRRIPEALSAARRAKGALAAGHADLALRRQVEARVDDLELLADLEEARLEGAAVKDGHFDDDLVDRRFGDIFRKSNLDLEAGSLEEAATRIRASTVALELASLLDEWSMVRRTVNPNEEQRWKRLLHVAQTADPDAWRTQAREALARQDQEALKRLASSDQALQLLPWTLSAVGRMLSSQGAWQPAEALLRKAQQRYPDDFWLNDSLAHVITEQKHPSQKGFRGAEAVPFYRVCVALRPQSPGARNNLGAALSYTGDLDGAIAEEREAIRLKGDYANAHHNLGVDLFDKRDLDGAIAAFRTTISLNAKNKEAHNGLANALHEKKDLDGAIAEYRKAIDLDPNGAKPHNNLANCLRDKKDLDGAIAEYRKAIDLDPKYAKAHNSLGLALEDKKEFNAAIAEYRKAIDLDPKYVNAHLNLGNALKANHDVEGAIVEYRKAIDLDPKDVRPRNNLGNALRDQKKLDDALAEYRKAIDLDPKHARAHNGLGNVLHDRGQLDKAIAEYRQAIDLDPEAALFHDNLGTALRDKKEFDAAIAEYRKAIELDATLSTAHNNLGIALANKNDLDGAIAAFRQAIALDASYAKAHYNLGKALGDKHDLNGAIAAYRQAVEIDPKYAIAHHNLGRALHDKHDLDGAIAAYRQAIALDPKDALAHENLGKALGERNEFDAAIAELRQAVELDPKNAKHYNALGIVLKSNNQLDDAVAAYRKAIDLDPKYALAYYNLGIVLTSKNQPDEAIAAYRKAIALKPDHAEAHCNLGYLLRDDKGQFAAALEELQKGHQLGSKQPGWPYPSGQWVKDTERMAELDRRLTAILEGKEKPADDAERLGLAKLCMKGFKKFYAASGRFYAEAFANDAKLAEDMQSGNRYNAACAAALAGCGQGGDAAKLDDAERGRWRQQALDWLRADLTLWGKQLEGDKPPQVRLQVQGKIRHWQQDTDFAGVRGDAALAKLPEAERQAWRQFWSDVQQLLDRAAANPAALPEKKP